MKSSSFAAIFSASSPRGHEAQSQAVWRFLRSSSGLRMDIRAYATWCCSLYSALSSACSPSSDAICEWAFSRMHGRTSPWDYCSHSQNHVTCSEPRASVRIQFQKNCCHFFHSSFVFLLTLVMHESIHSSTALHIAASMQPIEKGRIDKWQRKRQPRKHLLRRPRKRQQRRSSSGTPTQQATL